MNPQEHVLSQILGPRSLLNCARDQGEHQILVAVDQLLKRALFAGTAPLHELTLVDMAPSANVLEHAREQIVSHRAVKQFRKGSSLISSSESVGGRVEEMFINPFLIPILAIVGSFLYAIVKTLAHSRVRELEIRERIAMIERGLVPPPEVDPKGFERAMSHLDRHELRRRSRGQVYGGRHRRAGVTLMGVGFGLMVLITFTGESPSTALGVGGFLVVMGVAFFVNGLIDTRPETYAGSSVSTSPSVPVAAPPEPPTRD